MNDGESRDRPGDDGASSTETEVQRVSIASVDAVVRRSPEEEDRRVRRLTPFVAPTAPRSTAVRVALLVMNGPDAGRLIMLGSSPVVLGRGRQADVRLVDPGVSREHARIGPGAEGSYYVEDLGSANGTFLGARRISLTQLRPGDYVQLGALLLRFDVTDDVAGALHTKLYDSAVRDGLTGAFNRQYLTTRLAIELGHAQEAHVPLALLCLGLDRLAQINDRCGFTAGDRVLCHVTALVMRSVRVEDVVARHGGDEVVVLATDIEPLPARVLAQRLCGSVREMALTGSSTLGSTTPLTVSCSIGVACSSEVDDLASPEALVALAERRLARAKEDGRDRVVAKG